MMKMNGNLFFMELRRNALSLILWITVITVLISVTMSVYGTFVQNQSQVIGMMSLLPKGALEFKGISNVTDLFSVLGYYSANNTIYMMLLGSIFAIVLGSNILLKEEYNKTAELLMSRPITRGEIFFSKLAVLAINVFLLNLVTSLAGLISMEIVKTGPFSFKSFLILSFYTFLLNAFFGAAGLFLSTLIKRAKAITTFCIALVLIFYFLHTLSKITESVAMLGYLSPFRFVNVEATKSSYSLDPWHLLYFCGITLVFSVLAFRIYLRKDIYT